MTTRSAIATSDTGSCVEQLDLRVALVAVSVAFYALTLIPLHAELGPGIVSLSVVPVALAGWLFGLCAWDWSPARWRSRCGGQGGHRAEHDELRRHGHVQQSVDPGHRCLRGPWHQRIQLCAAAVPGSLLQRALP